MTSTVIAGSNDCVNDTSNYGIIKSHYPIERPNACIIVQQSRFSDNPVLSYLSVPLNHPYLTSIAAPKSVPKQNTKGIDELDSAQDKVDEGDNSCVICLERANTVAFDPCGHIICCITCVKELQQQEQHSNDRIECPECRVKVNKVLRVYHS